MKLILSKSGEVSNSIIFKKRRIRRSQSEDIDLSGARSFYTCTAYINVNKIYGGNNSEKHKEQTIW